MSTKKSIYLDYAAATPMDPRVTALVSKLMREPWGNPSGAYATAKKAKQILEQARQEVAGILGVKSGEIIFTGSGTESDNLAILGVVHHYQGQGKHVIISAIEHLAVKRAVERLKKQGFVVSELAVSKKGIVSPEELQKHLRRDTILVSVMHANNEIGTIQPLKEMAEVLRKHRQRYSLERPFFHTDACQTAGFLNIRPQNLGVDLLSFNGSKIYGPKGVGVLYKKNNVQVEPILLGGSQERGWRAGTENVALATGLALALTIAEKEKKEEVKRLTLLRDNFINQVLAEILDSRLNGDFLRRLSNNINLSFKGVDGEMLMLALSQRGIECSTGSACTTGETGPSHVLKAMGVLRGWGNVRITLGRQTTSQELNRAGHILKKEVERLRRFS